MFADPSIFYANQAQGDGTFKAIATLFAEEGIDNLSPAPENNELLGMERILSHWMNLDQREPTLKIVCPKPLQDIAKPTCGIVNCGYLFFRQRASRWARFASLKCRASNGITGAVPRPFVRYSAQPSSAVAYRISTALL